MIDLDPGRAFGTGGHATTRLVIALAEEVADRPVARFLDLGCGSGILSIAAARLWPAARGLAVDVDPESVATTDENLALNEVTAVETRVGSLDDVAGRARPGARQHRGRRADRAGARISGAGGAGRDGHPLGRAGRPGRRRCCGAFAAAGLALEARRDEDEWAALRLRRP